MGTASSTGRPTWPWTGTATCIWPTGDNQRVQVLDPDGVFQLELRGQATLSKWAEEFFAANPDEGEPQSRSDLTPSSRLTSTLLIKRRPNPSPSSGSPSR